MHLHSVERLISVITLTLFATNAALIIWSGSQIDASGYAGLIFVGLMLIALGQFYRSSGRSEDIAHVTTGTGLLVLFTNAAVMFNYLLLPIGERRIDGVLMMLDAHLGYSWPHLVAATAAIPFLGEILRLVYLSSLVQMIVVILALGFAGRHIELHRFLLTGVIASLLTIGIWSVVPSSGPAAFLSLTAEVTAAINLVVGPSYGAELNRLVVEGPGLISPNNTLGLIAFPSYHTVMACTAVWFTFCIRSLFPFFLIVNILMLPAILVHGGHHLVDVFGGIAVFAIAAVISGRTVLRKPSSEIAISAPVNQS